MSLQFIADFDSQGGQTSPVLVTQWVTPTLVLTGHLDGYLRAWDAANGRLLAAVAAHGQSLNSLSSNRAGDLVLTGSIDGTVALRSTSKLAAGSSGGDLEPVASCASLRDHHSTVSPAFAVALHPYRPIFASTGLGGECSLHSAEASPDGIFGSHLSTASSNPSSSSSASPTFGLTLRFSPSGSLLALGTTEGHVHLHRLAFDSSNDLKEERPILVHVMTITSHALPIRSLAFSSETDRKGQLHDDLLIVGGDDAIITAYDVRNAVPVEGKHRPSVASKNPVAVLKGHRGPISSLCAVPTLNSNTAGSVIGGGSRLLSSISTADRTVRIWDLSARPKAAVFVTTVDVGPSGGLDWRKPPPVTVKNGEEEAAKTAGLGAAFVVSGKDGKVKWYRLAGTGLDAAEERDAALVANGEATGDAVGVNGQA
ncbi:WD40 repeat-like protein [Jaminaea rosea]|uniref:WD40 repeat-like protein n=1 Tax=Jaminaea rosea TaxID=1569628 RepID=A0A316V078_9BASI|nr:WD40 repeat-like protein [Jaminaea rosea]PWN30882.1 WD40 repeat-like protein [Jaminaea rosea]